MLRSSANVSHGLEIEICQKCLENSLPFQSLDDPGYELTVISQRNLSEVDMDRLSPLKFNPFQLSNDIALCGNSETLDTFFNMNQINCNYYLPTEFKEHTINNNLTNYFSLLHLQSVSNLWLWTSAKDLPQMQLQPETLGNGCLFAVLLVQTLTLTQIQVKYFVSFVDDCFPVNVFTQQFTVSRF